LGARDTRRTEIEQHIDSRMNWMQERKKTERAVGKLEPREKEQIWAALSRMSSGQCALIHGRQRNHELRTALGKKP
jgi:hypothetical protein